MSYAALQTLLISIIALILIVNTIEMKQNIQFLF